jgi:hypothetical protein
VVGRDHQLHAAQALIGEAAEELRPEDLRLRGAGGHAQHLALAVLVHRDGHYDGAADDAAVLADLEISRVEPEVGPSALDAALEEGLDPLVDVRAEPAHLALRDPGAAHGARRRSSTARVDTPCT